MTFSTATGLTAPHRAQWRGHVGEHHASRGIVLHHCDFSPATGDTNFSGSTSSALPYNVQDFKIAASPTTVTVLPPGGAGRTTLTITPLGGFNATLTYSCTGLPSEATCTFTLLGKQRDAEHHDHRALVKVGQRSLRAPRRYLLCRAPSGISGTANSDGKSQARIARCAFVEPIAVLALSTLWMPACGGGSSKPSNPGTPAGTSSVTVTATTGGTSALTHTTTVSLTVQ